MHPFPYYFFFLASVKTTVKKQNNGKKKVEDTAKEPNTIANNDASGKNEALHDVQNTDEDYMLEEKEEEKNKNGENTTMNEIMKETDEGVGESTDVRNDLDLNWNKDEQNEAMQALPNEDAVGMKEGKRDENKNENEMNEKADEDMLKNKEVEKELSLTSDEKNKVLEALPNEDGVNMEEKPEDTNKNEENATQNEKMEEPCQNAGKNNDVGKHEMNAMLQVVCVDGEDTKREKEKKSKNEEKSMEYEMKENQETDECARESNDLKNVEKEKKDEKERMNKAEKDEDIQEEILQVENEEMKEKNKEEEKENEETNSLPLQQLSRRVFLSILIHKAINRGINVFRHCLRHRA